MLKLARQAHSYILTRYATKSFSSGRVTQNVDNFRSWLHERLDTDPKYDLYSIFKQIKLTLPTTTCPESVYEAALNILITRKRLVDGSTILLHMRNKGFFVSNATQAKIMAVSLSTQLPEGVELEGVVEKICEIVGDENYTEADLVDLLGTMQVYSVDRAMAGIVITRFQESRGPKYTLPLRLLPDQVEALVREGKQIKALTILEQVPFDMNKRSPVKTVFVAYLRLLTALRDTAKWDAKLVDRILDGMEQREIQKQAPMNLLLAWAARQDKYISVLHFYTKIMAESTPDIYVYRALFEMHTTFRPPKNSTRMAPLAPRKLFQEMRLLLEKPDTYLLTTIITAFMQQRDYAAALVALDSFAHFDVKLDSSTFYTVIKPLTHRLWADISNKRRIREAQRKWGDLFLGARFDRVVLSTDLVSGMLDKVSREHFSVNEPLFFPGPAKSSRWRLPEKQPTAEEKEKNLQANWGVVKYPVPAMEAMETVYPDSDIAYDPTPLKRLLRRALFAQVLLDVGFNEKTAMEFELEMVRQAHEDMLSRPIGIDKDDGECQKVAETEQPLSAEIPAVAVSAG